MAEEGPTVRWKRTPLEVVSEALMAADKEVIVEARFKLQGQRGTFTAQGKGANLKEAQQDVINWLNREYGRGSWEIVNN